MTPAWWTITHPILREVRCRQRRLRKVVKRGQGNAGRGIAGYPR